MSKKRFQDCNWLERLWRYRFYLSVVFIYLWRQYVIPLKVVEVPDNTYYRPKGKNLWELLIGDAQIKMNWVVEFDSVEHLIKYIKDEQ